MVFLAVKINGEYTTCSGTILTQRNILTAAHCIKQNGTYPTRIVAFYNSTQKLDGAFWRVDRMKVHPDFNETTFVNDIAILRVEQPFSFTMTTRPICISLEPVDIFHKHVRVAGWGRLKQFGPPQRLLYYTSLRVLSDEVCMRKFGNNGYNITLQFCAYEDTTDACEGQGSRHNAKPDNYNEEHSWEKGDSGGPAIARADNHRFLQVGIVSYGAACAGKVPGVYTRLDALVPWILDNVLYGTWQILYPRGEDK
ncbi:chymotrypsin-2-like isoform X2 [Dermacentor variabilis]|uniref:chymotrypsin-2-like isoform X1 n=1 Tax=Dermacentor variabilis TaxID=34621 RepID=UPI003F5BD606